MQSFGTYEPKNAKESVKFLQKLIDMKAWVALFATCITEYEGRGASKTTPGDKLVIIKPNGSIIIHGPRGFRPQNWQPDTSAIIIEDNDDFLVLKAIRRSPRESLTTKCSRVYTIIWLTQPTEGDFWMYINEHQIRDVIAENPDIIEEGLVITRIEKPVEPGFVDLYGIDSNGRLVVIELKRVKAGVDAVKQLLGYTEAFRKKGVSVRPILVAPDFTESAIKMAHLSGVELKKINLRRLYDLVSSRARPKKGTLEDFLDSSL